MAIIAWFLIIGLGALSIAAFARRYAQFGVFFGGTAIIAATATLVHFGALTVLVLCILWTVALVATVLLKANADFWVTLGVLILSAFLLLLTPLGNATSSPGDSTKAQAIEVATADGKSRQLDYVTNDASKPVSGKDVNTATTPPSLDDGKGPVHSWTELVQRVNGLPKAKHDAYVAAINSRSQYLGTWDDVQQYAALEKKDKNLDTRVIIVLNSDVTDKQARDAVRSDVGDATDKLPIVRISGALVNTRGVDAGKIEDFADGRAQIRVILTTPVVKKDDTGGTKVAADTDAASKGTGVLTECTNPSTGIVHHPKPIPVPPKKTHKPPTSTKTPPVTTPPSSTPPTSTPPTTTPPTTTPPTTTPPTTTPPTTTPPTTKPPTCPPGQTGTPPNCLETKGPVPYPSDKPSDNKTQGPPETKAPVETHPADPTDKPGDEVTDVPAPGATQGPTHEVTQPPATGAPTDDDKGTGIPEPKESSTPAASMALFPFGGGLLAWGLRRRRDKAAARR
jgi:hypothetical protein